MVNKMSIKREACDKWFSDVVRKKANHTCESCGRSDIGMDCAHIYGRREKSVRWSLDNAVCLCRVCHRNYTENPIDFAHWLNQYLGEGHMELLNEKRKVLMKTTKALRKEIAKHYREERYKMEKDDDYKPVSYN